MKRIQDIKISAPKIMNTTEERIKPSKKMFLMGSEDGLQQGKREILSGTFNMDTFNPTLNDVDFNDSYELGYEFGYMRAKIESLGFEIGSGLAALQKIEDDLNREESMNLPLGSK